MKRFIVSHVSFENKDILKTILPARSWQRWKFIPQTKDWVITLQSHQATKTFKDRLESFINRWDCTMKTKEWDGTNQGNNYD